MSLAKDVIFSEFKLISKLIENILKIGYFGKVIKVGSYCYHC
ncbi:hypothetical protein ANME2D_00934 [Candidatus Methanoperedens nitroreducens]|uniref:Uncharacterized protein n=1 Tax=Candidatus Methanoperedens nitratireducens TaxID=1392998 RepID=A0A062V5B9_9EURY|nr:hypothetical protein ANME2D_00934 [Candidatus Methanoperedens nitroreducens]